jgi:hypothetical protein
MAQLPASCMQRLVFVVCYLLFAVCCFFATLELPLLYPERTMTGETTTGGRGRNRGTRKRNNKRNKQQGPKKPNVPPPPQTKLIWRNIGNTEKHGTVEQILGMIQQIFEISNQKNSSQYTIEIDRSAVRYLIREEELAQNYLDKLQADREEKAQEEEEQEEQEEGEENDNELQEEEEENTNKQETEEVKPPQEEGAKLDVVVAPKLPTSVPVITARPLYVIPPKKSRRRGERGGCAYVLLTAPTIDKIEIPETLLETKEQEQVQEQSSENTEVRASPQEKAPPQELPAAVSAEAEAPPTLIPEGEAAKTETDSAAPTTTTAKPVPTVDYSSVLANRRLLLSRAIDFLAVVVQEDAKGPQEYAGSSIEPSMSGKTWRPQYRTDRREGTIEGTADYKNWLTSLSQKKEELNSRPKPTPGGGPASNLVGLSETGNDPAQPVATLVQHLNAKREELKRKKARKKKDKNDKAKTNKKKAGTGTRGGAPPAGGGAGKKKTKKATKKKGPGGAPKPSAAAPPTLLKSPSSGAAR